MRGARALPWILSGLVVLATAWFLLAASFGWYLSQAFAFDVRAVPGGMTLVSDSFATPALLSALITALIGGAVLGAVVFGLYSLGGRRRGPAMTAAVAGPAVAFILEALMTASDAVGTPAGEQYMGIHPVAIAGRSIIVLLPALLAVFVVMALVRLDRRRAVESSD